MATTPAVRASTQKKVRDVEIPRGNGDQLMRAIAATMQAGAEGRRGLERISEKLQAREKSQHAKDMKRRK